MVKLLQRMVAGRGRVDFCDECGQVCTSSCRAEAQRDRIRTRTVHYPLPR